MNSKLTINEINIDELDSKTASVTSRELSEAELSTVAGGAGKITFNPFSITRHVDKASPVLFL